MFFLLRVAFWLTIVLVLLPSGKSQPGASIAATDAVAAASAAVSDMSGFCTRQPEACVVGAQAATAIGQRAQAGAKMVYEFISDRVMRDPPADERSAPGTTGSVPTGAANAPFIAASQNTLTPSDLEPAWQGPMAEPVPLPRRNPRHRA